MNDHKKECMCYADGYADGLEINKDIYEAGRAEERKHLIGVVEEMRQKPDSPSMGANGYNEALDDLLTHLASRLKIPKGKPLCAMCTADIPHSHDLTP